jgi:site-specific DNA-methyltransferase (adenine-specific)
MKHTLINASCTEYLERGSVPEFTDHWDTIFADPPDNIGLDYNEYDDRKSSDEYFLLLVQWLRQFVSVARTVWFSYNAKWSFAVGAVVFDILREIPELEAKNSVQTFTFGQHNKHDLGNCHRPLLRLRWKDSRLFPDAIRVQSERQRMGDKRADPRGRVPGDVFDFPRVTGNSRQRRRWHSTQLHEGLVERCLKLTTPANGHVLDPFAGTGTTLRVAKRCGFNCDLIELDSTYCAHIAEEHDMKFQPTLTPTWTLEYAAAQPEDLPVFGGPQDTLTLGTKSQS